MATSTAIEKLKEYFAKDKTPTEEHFTAFIDSFVHRSENPKGQAEIFASKAETEAGTATNKYMNPYRTKQAIEALVNSSLIINNAPTALNTIAKIITAINDRYTKAELDRFFEGRSSGKKQVSWDRITNKPATFTPSDHDHDDRYYTESEINNFFEGTSSRKKQVHWDRITNTPDSYNPSYHTHNNKYYTKSEINNFFEGTSSDNKKLVHWNRITNTPATFTPSDHVHTKADVGLNKLPNEISDSYESNNNNVLATSSAVFNSRYWNRVIHKPTTFTPASHTHTWGDITNKPVGITGSRYVKDEGGRTEIVYIRDGIITSWTDLVSGGGGGGGGGGDGGRPKK